MAGVQVTCSCQRVVKVPSLLELRSGRFPPAPQPADPTAAAQQNVIVISVLGAIGVMAAVLSVFWLGNLTGIGLLLFVVGRLWMLVIGFRANPNLGCLLLLFPEIMMFTFAAVNPKLALPPLLCAIGGIMLFISGLAAHM